MRKSSAESADEALALYRAHLNGNAGEVKKLLKANPRLEAVSPMDGGSWLHLAAKSGELELVRFWLRRGQDVNRNIPGYSKTDGVATPLHSAANAAVTRLLISNGADLNAWTRYGGTPLHNAVVTANPAQIRTLLKAGADFSISDVNGRTPLALAVYLKRTDCERVLRDAGAPLKGRKPSKQPVPAKAPAIDLQKDAKRIRTLLARSVKRFAREHPRERVTAIALAASGIEGFVIFAVNTGEFSSAWDAAFSEYAVQHFEHWRYAYELAEGGVTITAADGGKTHWARPVADTKFQRPFFEACLAALRQAEESRVFDRLKRAPAFTIGVEMATGDHARFWRLAE